MSFCLNRPKRKEPMLATIAAILKIVRAFESGRSKFKVIVTIAAHNRRTRDLRDQRTIRLNPFLTASLAVKLW